MAPQIYERGAFQLGTSIFILCVGEEPNHVNLTVHENLIRKASKFFEAALDNEWVESQNCVIKLPTFAQSDVEGYINWLYTRRLYLGIQDKNNFNKIETSWESLLRGYVFGEYIYDTPYRDTLADAIIEHIRNRSKEQIAGFLFHVPYVFDQTISESPLQRLLVDISVWHMDASAWQSFQKRADDTKDSVSEDFWLDVVAGYAERCNGKRFSLWAFPMLMCQYHLHGEDACYRL